jgi:hypothetical protein
VLPVATDAAAEPGPASGVMERTEILPEPVVPPPEKHVDQAAEPIVIPGLESRGSRWPVVVLSFITFLSLSFAVYTSIQRPVTVAAAPRTAITLGAHTCAVETALRAEPPEPAPANAERVASASTRRPPRLVRSTSGQAIPVRGQHRAGIIRSMPF